MIHVKNLNKSTIVLASDCKHNPKLFSLIKSLIKKKFKNEDKEKLKISIIMTGRYGFRNKTRKKILENTKKKCKEWNYEKIFDLPIEFIDCSSKKNIDNFKKSIDSTSIIWVMGGDTLYLMYNLKKSKMDKYICDKLKEKNMIYVGCCAGAIIAGDSVYPTFIARNYKKSKRHYLKNTYKNNHWTKKNQKALGLVPKVDILPHCKRGKTIKYRTKNIYCLPEYKPLINDKYTKK